MKESLNMDSVLDFVRLAAAIGVGVLSADVCLGILVAAQARRKRAQALDKVKDFEQELYNKLMPRMKDIIDVEAEDEEENVEGEIRSGRLDKETTSAHVVEAGLGGYI